MNWPVCRRIRLPMQKAPSRRWVVAMLIVLLTLLGLACNLPVFGTSTGEEKKQEAVQGKAVTAERGKVDTLQGDELSQAMSLDHALNIQLEDNRSQVLKQMGPPDTFRITFQQLNGKPVRQEEWSYVNDATRFDFVNGALLWTLDLEPAKDLTVNAAIYDPLSFEAGMTQDQVQALLKGQQLLQVDLEAYGAPAAIVLAGDQILLGFDQDGLVFVQTFGIIPVGKP